MGKKKRVFAQLCWKCKKCCDSRLCIWVRTLKRRYKGIVIDSEGFIIKCPKFERDNLIYSNKEMAEKLGISIQYFNNLKSTIKRKKLNMSVEEYLKYQKDRKEDRKTQLANGLTSNQYYYAKRIIKKRGLNISPEEYYKQKEAKKNEKELNLALKSKRINVSLQNKETAEKLGISLSRYCYLKFTIKKKKLNMSVEEYLKYQEDKKEEARKRKSTNELTTSQYYYALKVIKARGLNITPKEYYRQKEAKRKERELKKMKRLDINDIDGILNDYLDYTKISLIKPLEGLKLVGIINNAFSDTYYYVKENSKDKIIYFEEKSNL